VLEGGYSTQNIANCGEAVIHSLMGEELPLKCIPDTHKTQMDLLMGVKAHDEAKRVTSVMAKLLAK
jgi:hypothetical protein